MSPSGRALLATVAIAPGIAHAEDDNGRSGAAYAFAGAEIALAGTIAIHSFTASTPGEGIGLAVNFLPVIVGVGAGLFADAKDLDPRPALGFHGAVVGGLSMMAIGASFDGRDEYNGVKLGALALSLGTLGAASSAYLGITRIDDQADSIAITTAPLLGLAAGGLTFAIVHFLDDKGPKATGQLLRYAGVGMLLGTVGGYSYAFAF